MVFSSTVFLFLFLPLILALYFVMPQRGRNLLLLAASLLFYAWGEGFYVAIMLVSIAMNYVAGRAVDRWREVSAGKVILLIAIAANLLLLGVFKYANFVVDNLNLALAPLGLPEVQLDPVHLPIGISFFTFQAMSYVIDVYRRQSAVQHNPINSALYISLFPQLIAGPIVRYHDIARQLVSRRITLDLFASGITLFIIGLGKKMLIANPMGGVADQIFAIPEEHLSAPLCWLGMVCYTLQIYFDFSGYSDMAIGLGRLFGFRFLINFNYPYIAQSIQEFWRRWHISLSRWFRDYLYIPLGGNRKGPWRTYFNLMTVFILCGLWHGASWNFVIWGLIHGCFLILERTGPVARGLSRIGRPLRHTYVLLVVMMAWVFFRADSLDYALSFVQALWGFGADQGLEYHTWLYLDREVLLVLVVGIIGSTPLLPGVRAQVKRLLDRPRLKVPGMALARVMAPAVLIAGLILIKLGSAMHLAAGTHNPFIYFRF